MNIKEMSPEELAAFVCSHLKENNIDVVLSGGSCVSIYSENKYRSYDFDFIPRDLFLQRKRLKEVLLKIGYSEENRYFKHPDSEYLLEFPPGPLTVGDEPVKEIAEKVYQTGTLRMLSATECVKDRLAGFYHWKDLQCLNQAILVCEDNEVDENEIQRWSITEGKEKSFLEIQKQLFS